MDSADPWGVSPRQRVPKRILKIRFMYYVFPIRPATKGELIVCVSAGDVIEE